MSRVYSNKTRWSGKTHWSEVQISSGLMSLNLGSVTANPPPTPNKKRTTTDKQLELTHGTSLQLGSWVGGTASTKRSADWAFGSCWYLRLWPALAVWSWPLTIDTQQGQIMLHHHHHHHHHHPSGRNHKTQSTVQVLQKKHWVKAHVDLVLQTSGAGC